MEATLTFQSCLRPFRDLSADSPTGPGDVATSRESGMTLLEVIMAIGLFVVVTAIVVSIIETTFKAQRQAELKYDIQTFLIRLTQDLDCDKTLKVGEPGALYDHDAGVFPTNATCGFLTLRDSRGDPILEPNPGAQDLFVGAGAISKNWWGRAECDESQRSVTLSIALRKRGTWNEFGKNPLREPKDENDTQYYMSWTNPMNPVFGGQSRPKLCEKYFTTATLKRQSCASGQYGTGYNSQDLRCAPLPSAPPSPAAECGTGQIMISFNMRTNTPTCRAIATSDLDANGSIATWIQSQLVPQCYSGQMFLADGTNANTMICGAAFPALRCFNATSSDYFPGSSAVCSGVSGYSGTSASVFDFRQIQYMSNSN